MRHTAYRVTCVSAVQPLGRLAAATVAAALALWAADRLSNTIGWSSASGASARNAGIAL